MYNASDKMSHLQKGEAFYKGWNFLIVSSLLITGGIVTFSLLLGINVLVGHFLYIPVILLSYQYPRNGVVVSAAIAVAYFGAVILLLHPLLAESFVVAGHAAMFILIGGVVAILSSFLQEKDVRYQAVVETLTELICRFVPEGEISFVNEAYARYFGKNPSELVGSMFRPPIPVEDQEKVIAHFASLTPSESAGMIEHRMYLPDGTIGWHQWNNQAIFADDGTILEYQSVGRDITDRKEAEERLQQSEDLYRTIFETTGTGMMIMEDDGTVVLANREVEALYGHPRSDLVGSNSWIMLIGPGDRERVLTYLKQRGEGTACIPRSYEVGIVNASGIEHETMITVEQIPGTHRRVISLEDISKQKQAERLIAVANSINQFLVHERDAEVLLEKACREFSYLDRYLIASIALFEDEKIRPVAISDPSYASMNESYLLLPEVRNTLRRQIPALIPSDTETIPCLFAIPMIVNDNALGVIMVYLLPESALGEKDLESLQVLANDLAYALNAIRVEEQKQAALIQIEKNMEQLSILNDSIRNPLQGIVGIADLEGGSVAEKILPLTTEIDAIVNLLDIGCLQSEKIRDFLIRHYNIKDTMDV
jgi:PAS domain S-box-containing protein